MARDRFRALDRDIRVDEPPDPWPRYIGHSRFPRAAESFLLPICEQSTRKILRDNCAAYCGLPA